jgi:hypothetical protein
MYYFIILLSKTTMSRKPDGFNNQLAIIIPTHIQAELYNNPFTKLLYISDIGYYPSAQYHFRERSGGCEQNILIFCTEGRGWVSTNERVGGFRRKEYTKILDIYLLSYKSNHNPYCIVYAIKDSFFSLLHYSLHYYMN